MVGLEAVPAQRPRGDMTLTLDQIAELAGVSRSTASRVINGRPGVRAEVRERVWQIIHEQGYHPNAVARSLASRRSKVVEAEEPAKQSGRGKTGLA